MIDLDNIIADALPGIELFDALLFFLLIFTRFLLMTVMMPFLGAQLLPSLLRIALAALFSIINFILLIESHVFTPHPTIFLLGLLFVKEALIGCIIGFLASLVFFAYELFGELVDTARAANTSKLFVPELKHQSSPLGTLFFQLALVLFVSMGFHRHMIETAYQSFIAFPVTSFNSDMLHHNFLFASLDIIGTLFEMALRFALPVVVISFLIDMAFGLMNRVAPHINAYFLSLPAKMVGGLLMLFFALPFLLDDFLAHQQKLTHFIAIFIGK